VTQSENTISQATFSPSGTSPRSLWGCQQCGTGVSCSFPAPSADSFALGREATLSCLEGAEGRERDGEVTSSCCLSPPCTAQMPLVLSSADEPKNVLSSCQMGHCPPCSSGCWLASPQARAQVPRRQEVHKELRAPPYQEVKLVSSQC